MNSHTIKEESDSLNSSVDNSERVYESPHSSIKTAPKRRRHHSNKSVPHAKDSSNSLKNIHVGSLNSEFEDSDKASQHNQKHKPQPSYFKQQHT